MNGNPNWYSIEAGQGSGRGTTAGATTAGGSRPSRTWAASTPLAADGWRVTRSCRSQAAPGALELPGTYQLLGESISAADAARLG